VRYNAARAAPLHSGLRCLAGDVDRDYIRTRIIVLGTSSVGCAINDPTPVDASVRIEIHAQVLEQALAGAWLMRAGLVLPAPIAAVRSRSRWRSG